MMDYTLPFSAWSGPRHPRVLFIGEAWGEDEEALRAPFVGESGKEFWRMLGEAAPDLFPELHSAATDLHRYGLAWVRSRGAWLEAAGLAFTNVFNLRPPDNKIPALCLPKKDLPRDYPFPAIDRGLYLRPDLLPHIARLQAEIDAANPTVLVPMGNTACWAILHTTNITAIRGAVAAAAPPLAQFKVLPTIHPAAVLRTWKWRPIIISDLMKALRESRFPEIRRPARHVLVNGTLQQYEDWTALIMNSPPQMLSCDIETGFGLIKCVGFGADYDEAVVFPFMDNQGKSCWDVQAETFMWRLVFELLESKTPKLFQNGLYDLQYLWKMGCRPRNCLEDTMLLHHALFPEMQKGLGFLGSIYTDEPAWKLMRRKRPDTEKRDE